MRRWFRVLGCRIRGIFARSRLDEDFQQELDAHLEMLTEENIRRGMPPEEARRAARVRLGGLTQLRESNREMWGLPWLETLLQDLRYGLRQLRRNPGFTAVAVLILALGIGANTAIFSVIDAVLLHAVPYQNPSQLVEIAEKNPQSEQLDVSPGDFSDCQRQTRIFRDVAAYNDFEFHALAGGGEPDEVWTVPVSTNFFRLLGVGASIGRTFSTQESHAIVLSHEYWASHFESNPKILGKTLALDGKPYTVIGVAPPDFQFPNPNVQVWVSIVLNAADMTNHKDHSFSVIARLKGGISLKEAQAAMKVVGQRLGMEYPKTNAKRSFAVKPFQTPGIEAAYRATLFVLLGAVIFVLMIACANVASMLLARGAARQGEMAIRAALGASRWRLIRFQLLESVMLAAMASAAGLVLASSGLGMIKSLVPKYTPLETQAVHQIAINLPVLGFAVALAFLTGVVVGLLPALRLTNLNLNESLKESARTSRTGTRGSRLQRSLVVLEVTLALVLLIGGGLMIQTFERLETAPMGFNPDHLLTVRVPLMKYKYSEGPQSVAFYRDLLERIRAIHGVESAGMVNNLPFTGFQTTSDFPAPAKSPGGRSRTIYVSTLSVSPGYFKAMDVPLKEGRVFTEADNQKDARCVRIINEAMARRYWPGKDPVGTQVSGACRSDAPGLIVGIVADSKQNSVESQAIPELYVPYGQFPFASFLMTFVIRTASHPLAVAGAVRHTVWEVNQNQPVIQVRSMRDVISESIWRQHLSASMLGILAAIALVLSAVGIFGVISYSVSQRTHEIGIRMALGAEKRDVLWMLLQQGLKLAFIGVAIGIAGALALTRFLASLLYGVKPTDPLTFTAVSVVLIAVALVACYIPARRAAKVDPMVALRYE